MLAPAAAAGGLVTPAGWTAAALLLWAHACGQLALVAPLALLIEMGSRLSLRFDFEARQFERCADASSVAFAGLALYQFNVYGLYGIYEILALMPWCLVPLTLMQCWSTLRETPLSALVYSLRRAGATTRIDLRLALGLSALLAASAAEVERNLYGAGVAVLLGWLLWARRPHRAQQARWLLHAALAGGLALGVQSAYLQLHLALGDLVQDWFREMNLQPANAERASTAIGSLRQLKLSDRIYLRVRTDARPQTPLLLTEATYGDFRYGTWSNPRETPVTVDAQPGARRWRLSPTTATAPRYELALVRDRELGVVPLPAGAIELDGERILDVRRLAGDALQIEAPIGLLTYTVTAAADAALHPPVAGDLVVPADYRALIDGVAASLQLPAQARSSAEAAIARLRDHFRRHFRYSLVQASTYPWRTPLANFLSTSHRGHCEYFASATVLLLRAAGIPARYAVGYAVDEYSPLEQAWLARARDAHAWAYAWYGDAWHVVDLTPSNWAALEDAHAAPWQAWFDTASWLAYAWRRLQAGQAPGLRLALGALAMVLAGWLVWRQRHRLRHRAPLAVAAPSGGAIADTPLAPLLERLARRGRLPAPGETLGRFLRRQLPATSGTVELETLIGLYYTARFGARALDAREQARLEASVAAYLRDT